jgi:FkbM family methyltransferase
MKKIIQSILGLFGIRVIRAKYARKYLPKPNIDNIELVIRFYSLMNKRISVLQVGACDGVTSDSIFPYIQAGAIDAYLIEPSSLNFKKLSEFHVGNSNVTLINAAVADKDEKRIFYTIKDEGRWKDNGWARQLASFYKEHLIRHKILESEIATEEVNCLTLKSVISRYSIKKLDVLLIDTEGYDGEIVKMAMAQGVHPTFVAFENAQLVQMYSQEKLEDLYATLTSHNYVWTHDRINTLAVKKDFFIQDANVMP